MLSAIVSSKRDPASRNILNCLLEICSWNKTGISLKGNEILQCDETNSLLITIDSDLTSAEFLSELPILVERLIFISRHEATSKKPSLLIHFTGNWTSNAMLGGYPNTLGISDPIFAKYAFIEILREKEKRDRLSEFEISLEATHHGPTQLNKPLTFIEIGSDPDKWRNKEAGEAWAHAIIRALERLQRKKDYKNLVVAIGFGGPHYAPNFSKVERETCIAMGHIAPKYVIDQISPHVLRQAYLKNMVKPKLALIDWKGLTGAQREKVITLLKELNFNLEIVKIHTALRKYSTT